MKLFRKTLLFFVGAIVFQSALTLLMITRVTRQANLADARRELAGEAAVLYEGYNAWKRQIWRSLIGISADSELARQDMGERARSLRELLLAAKVDAIFIRDSRGRIAGPAQAAPGFLALPDLGELANERQHPYIEPRLLRGTLCLVGISALAAAPGEPPADLFLLKRLDDEFCDQLTLNRRSRVAFLLGDRPLAGSFPAGPAASFFDPAAMRSAYLELYDRHLGRESVNAAFQRLGPLGREAEGRELFLATFLSNEPYDDRLLLLDRTILAVSLAGALLTVALSLFLSRAITHPVAELLAGMERIRDGAWDTRVRARGGLEIHRLFHAFNEMARELHDHIRETVLLKEYNEKIIHSIRAGIAILDQDLVVEKANRCFLESFGLEAARVVGTPLTELEIEPVDVAMVEKIRSILRGELETWSEIKRSRSGRVHELRLHPFRRVEGAPAGCLLMTDDISAKTELEEKIFQAEKLSTVSMLSAGMAHEINNPLGSILTNVQNLLDEERDPERRVALKWIEQETRRIARIVQELLNFASADCGQAPGADANAVVREVVRLVSHPLAREGRVRIDTRLAAGLPPAAVSPDELKQVVVNLLKNSLQAIDGPGRILVSTRPQAGPDGAPGLALSVSDSGRGIPRDILPRIFDPFFTTKANGLGTGLGLSVVYGIVAKHNGSVDVKSRPGRGTRITLRLPRAGGES